MGTVTSSLGVVTSNVACKGTTLFQGGEAFNQCMAGIEATGKRRTAVIIALVVGSIIICIVILICIVCICRSNGMKSSKDSSASMFPPPYNRFLVGSKAVDQPLDPLAPINFYPSRNRVTQQHKGRYVGSAHPLYTQSESV